MMNDEPQLEQDRSPDHSRMPSSSEMLIHDDWTLSLSNNPLIVPQALELSLSPPRFPPIGTWERSLYTARSDRHTPSPHLSCTRLSQRHYSVNPNRNRILEESTRDNEQAHSASNMLLRQHVWEHWHQNNQRVESVAGTATSRRHPHVARSWAPHSLTRRLVGQWWSVSSQNHFRDQGYFRQTVDGLVMASVPLVAAASPRVIPTFVQLWRACVTMPYGPHNRQYMHWYPTRSDAMRGVIFFVHGGAWGSGDPWMYRLVAAPFLDQGWSVALVGYRTHPDAASVSDQVDDLELAVTMLQTTLHANDTVILMGHSSGAHIALALLVQRAIAERTVSPTRQSLPFTAYVGLSGPYNIAHHFEYEAARGVEEVSPMKAVAGGTHASFVAASPACALQRALRRANHDTWSDSIPPVLLLHGIVDDTVPFTATAEAARVLRSCGVSSVDEMYVADTGHQDVVMQLMLGGEVQDAVLDWIQECRTERPASRKILRTSKL